MRALDAAEISAIQARTVVAREFLWVTARNRDTGAPESRGLWNEVFDATVQVRDGRTGAIESRAFHGVGGALAIGPVPLTSDITVRTVEIALPHIDDVVELLVRGFDVRGAPMQAYRGYLDPATRALVAPAKARFVGYVDGAPIVTPAEGGEGSVTINCVSTTRELTRTTPDVRSHESQLARTGGTDHFYADAGVVGQWEMIWGLKDGPVVGDKRDVK